MNCEREREEENSESAKREQRGGFNKQTKPTRKMGLGGACQIVSFLLACVSIDSSVY